MYIPADNVFVLIIYLQICWNNFKLDKIGNNRQMQYVVQYEQDMWDISRSRVMEEDDVESY